ncbi:protein of unknown function [Amycolatopsis marina]|uniref:DUF4383 domain-containing protein n=1 Tax=Amycolatopsis marina TaxID=490629 RepID=A0A1I0Y1Z0_9PSEU|nr:DUF4383 domain-containing protein [Amycolatopsis marina]SFB06666.1 protein of unknown function [Amycolatopsis marina]
MTEGRTHSRTGRKPVQLFATLVGVVFLAVGVLGFIPGITSEYNEMGFAGPDSMALLFGLFGVSVLHNLVHLLFGVLGLVAATTLALSRAFLMIGGGFYVLLCVYGLPIDRATDANFLPVNPADNWLHLGLGLGMIALGLLGTALERRSPGRDSAGY